MNTLLKNILLTTTLVTFSLNASADWVLKNAESSLNVVSIKKLTTGEIHTFSQLKGTVKKTGDVSVAVKLSSIETNIPIRDDRMQQFLFEVVKFPEATVTTRVNYKHIEKMKAGDSMLQKAPLKLSLHGHKLDVMAEMRVTLLSGNKLLVSTVKPVIINASEFALVKGIDKLKELAKLPSISTAIPVSVSFVFEKKGA